MIKLASDTDALQLNRWHLRSEWILRKPAQLLRLARLTERNETLKVTRSVLTNHVGLP
jgi:hypothetical protein